MSRPYLDEIPVYKETTDTFLGYNHRLGISEGSFYNTKNLTAQKYPVMSPRRARGIWLSPDSPQGMISKESLCYVDGSKIIIKNDTVDLGLSTEVYMQPKTLVSFGAYILVLPDKKYINTNDITDRGDIEASMSLLSPETIYFIPCMSTGENYTSIISSSSSPDNPENNTLWLDTSQSPYQLMKYSSASASWVQVISTYVKILTNRVENNIGEIFNVGDAITISGIRHSDLTELNTTAVIVGKEDNYIIIPGIIGKEYSYLPVDTTIKITREMPKMDYIVESNNRLWGCRYGENNAGEFVNEIYASKLGDFKNWSVFQGISTDSYTVSLGSDGPFTGAVSYRGYPHFFKEKCVHKILGTQPSNYQLSTIEMDGVCEGCEKSLAIVGDVLYYKSRSGVCAYDGSYPVDVSEPLGGIVYKGAVAGALGSLYYISMYSGNMWYLFSYDTDKRIWMLEDNTRVMQFCEYKGELYFISAGKIKIIGSDGRMPDETAVEWMAETGEMGTSSPEKKYITRLSIRMKLNVSSRINIYASYDSGKNWESLYCAMGTSLKSYCINVRPKRCDHLKLKFTGIGDAEIYSITKYLEYGSEF